MNKFFQEISNYFGFGCMRLPMKNDEVDLDQFKDMIDKFIGAGLNYFDTAHGYIEGKSELALRTCLVDRYPRNKYLLADKLTYSFINQKEDVVPFVNNQLKILNVDYFDFYLMHALNKNNVEIYRKCDAYNQLLKLKKDGKLHHIGFSFHDTPEVLEMLLNEFKEVDFVQLQINYFDWENDRVNSRKCYEVCLKYNKPVIVMEPVKGGTLHFLPKKAQEYLKSFNNNLSNASYALRFVRGLDNVMMVLSGMSNYDQMLDNLNTMTNFKPLDEGERKIIDNIVSIIKKQDLIACTNCRYCVDGCPKKILIPDLFKVMNDKIENKNLLYKKHYEELSLKSGLSYECIKCGKCEKTCPQKLPIRDLLVNITREFE